MADVRCVGGCWLSLRDSPIGSTSVHSSRRGVADVSGGAVFANLANWVLSSSLSADEEGDLGDVAK